MYRKKQPQTIQGSFFEAAFPSDVGRYNPDRPTETQETAAHSEGSPTLPVDGRVTADTATFKSGVVEPALTDYSRHSMAEKREQVLARIVAAIDGAAMVVILTAILLQLRNADNWIFLLNLPHTCWWLVTLIIAGTLPSRAWFNVYIVMTASWFLLDVGSFIWRAILLHSCLHSSHSHSCRDFLLQSWFVIASNAVFLLTTICCLVLAVLLQKHSFQDRLHAHQEERRYAKLVQSTY